MKRFIDALLLKGLWKFKPVHVVLLWIFLAYNGWMGSPYFMYYVVGAPEPGTAPRYVGKLRVEGELRRTRNGWSPPSHFVETKQGDVEFHCGYIPYKRECFLFTGAYRNFKPEDTVEVGYDSYWGLDYFKFPPSYAHLNDYGGKESAQRRRIIHLDKHYWPTLWFCLGASTYLLAVIATLLPARPNRPPRVRRPGDVPFTPIR